MAHFLGRGLHVSVYDPSPDTEPRVRGYVESAWPTLERLGLVPGADAQAVSFHDDPAAAVADAQFVQESGTERLDAKRAIYAQLEPGLPDDVIVASSTSGFTASDLQKGRVGPQRYLVGHPFHPPHVLPLVEVVGGKQTDPAAVDWLMAFYTHHGKRAVRLNKEVPGHMVNRLQVAMWREAIHMVNEGVASVADVDAAIACGPALRWAIFGPHTIMHLSGGDAGIAHQIDHIGPEIERWWQDMGTPHLTPEVRAKLIEGMEQAAGDRTVADMAAERDELLVGFLELKAAARQRRGG